MKRRLISLILMITVFLSLSCGCSSQNADANAICEQMRAVSSADFRVTIYANFPAHTAEYTVDYNYIKDGAEKISVTAPESIADISVTIENGETELVFDGARLETGRLDESGLSPLSALPSLMNSWVGGNVSESASSKHDSTDCTLIISRHTTGETALEYRTWFEKNSKKPLYAEIFSNGERVIQCEFERTEYR